MRKTDKTWWFVLLAITLFLAGCDRSVVFEAQRTLPVSGWSNTEKLEFKAEIDDTTSLHNMYINVRNTTDYEFSNLYLFLDIEFPDGNMLRDTLECKLAQKDGNWIGRGFGKIRSNRFLFRTDVWFPMNGVYLFRVEQAMRTDLLKGISDIGVRIERKRN